MIGYAAGEAASALLWGGTGLLAIAAVAHMCELLRQSLAVLYRFRVLSQLSDLSRPSALSHTLPP